MRTLATVLLAAVLLFGLGMPTVGCSDHTTKTTRVERQDADGEVRTETTITKVEDDDDDDDDGGGIISGTVDAVGWIISLPFKIVGGLIDIIF